MIRTTKKFLSSFLLLLLLVTHLYGQQDPAAVVRFGTALPASCNPAGPNIFFKTSATIGLYQCLTPNAWTIVVPGGGGTGNVTTAVTLTANAIVLGNGTVDTKVLASLGSSGQVLTSNGAGVPPSFQASPGLTVGTTTITGGTSTRIFFNNAGVLGEYTLSGTGTVVAMATSPDITTSLTTPSASFSLVNANATTVNLAGAATTLNLGANAAMVLNFGGGATAAEFRFLEPSGSGTNFTAFKAVAQAANITYSLPATVGAAGTFLRDAAGNGVLDWAIPAGSGTINSGVTNAIPKYTAATTIDDSLLTDDGTTLSYTGTGGFSLTGGTGAGTLELIQGTAPSLGTTSVKLYADTAVTSYKLRLPAAAGTGFLLGTNTANDVVLTSVGFTGTGNVVRDTSPNVTGLTVSNAAVTNNVVQNSQSAAYTTVLADAGKHILHPTADNNPRTFTIDSNANVAYPIGTTITFVNQINTVTIAITSDTLVLAGAGTTGSRTLAANGIATAIKIASTVWIINGTGLT